MEEQTYFTIEDQERFAEEMQKVDWRDQGQRLAVADTIVRQISDEMDKNDLVRMFADVIRFKLGQTMQFQTRKGAKAYVKAPGAVTPKSTIVIKTLTIDAEEVGAGLEFELDQLKSGRYGNVNEIKNHAKEALLSRKYKQIWDTLRGSVGASDANYFSTGSTTGAAVKLGILNDAIDYVEDQIGGVRAIVGRRTDLSFLLRFGGSTDISWSEKAKDRIIGTGKMPFYRGYPLILLNNWKNDYYVDQIASGDIMVVNANTVKVGVQRNLDVLEELEAAARMWSIYWTELYGTAVFFPERNAKFTLT
jgi:hypothetical protein